MLRKFRVAARCQTVSPLPITVIGDKWSSEEKECKKDNFLVKYTEPFKSTYELDTQANEVHISNLK